MSNTDRARLNAVHVVFEHLAQTGDTGLFAQFVERLSRAQAGEDMPRGALPTAIWQCEVTESGTLRYSNVRRMEKDGTSALHILEIGHGSGCGLVMLEETSEHSPVMVFLTAASDDRYKLAAIKARNMYRILIGGNLA